MADEHIHPVSLEIRNFRRIRLARVRIVPEKGLVRVTGTNREGKSSVLAALAVLGGGAEIHEDSLHEGAEKGWVKVALDNGYTVERRFTEANPKGYLDVVGKDGGRHGQSKLNGWLGDRSFDPQAFFTLPADRQRDALFSIADDPSLEEKLDAVRAEHDRVYEKRTPVISERRSLAKIKKPDGERPDPIDTSEQMERLRELRQQERARDEIRTKVEKAATAAHSIHKDVVDGQEEVRRLEQALTEAKKRLRGAEQEEAKAKDRFRSLKEQYEAMDDPGDEMEVVQDRIEGAQKVQEELEPWRRWDDAQERIESLREEEEALTARLRELEAKEAELLKDSGIPVEGLSFDEDGAPLLNGRDLGLASGAERIELAVQVALAADPTLRVCLVDEGDALDLDALDRLNELAIENDFHIWICRIGLEGDGEVLVEDGIAWSNGDEPPSPDEADDEGEGDAEKPPTEPQAASEEEEGDSEDADPAPDDEADQNGDEDATLGLEL